MIGGRRARNGDDRRHLFESAPHGIEPAGKTGDAGRLIGSIKSDTNTKRHAVTDANGRPLSFHDRLVSQRSYWCGRKAQLLIADPGYDVENLNQAAIHVRVLFGGRDINRCGVQVFPRKSRLARETGEAPRHEQRHSGLGRSLRGRGGSSNGHLRIAAPSTTQSPEQRYLPLGNKCVLVGQRGLRLGQGPLGVDRLE